MIRTLEMKKYREVPQWWYGLLFLVSLGIGIGCSVSPSVCYAQLRHLDFFLVRCTDSAHALVEHYPLHGPQRRHRSLPGLQCVAHLFR